ncbi:MAG: D-alanine-D-alanine ligase [Nocardioidaceae bacterium]|nr:D-alanine-D-alanine ligase [Nocardioidaceae bacterium]
MRGRVRVALIGGGQSCEHEVSLASAAAVADALDPAVYDAVRLTIDCCGRWHDAQGRRIGLAGAVQAMTGCAVVLPVVHGPRGEDGTIAALCELAGVPYVGSGVRAGALAMDKWATKLVAEAVGIATAPGVLLTADTAAAYLWTHRVVVKPVSAGSSLGVSLAGEASELPAAIEAALGLDDRILVEDVVDGREIDIAVLGTVDGARTVTPSLEVVGDGLFDFDAKYGGAAHFRIPAPLGAQERQTLEDAAIAMFDSLGCAGVARVDFFLTPAGLVLNEVNTMPGFTEQSQVPKMFAAAGVPYPALLDTLVRDALRTS